IHTVSYTTGDGAVRLRVCPDGLRIENASNLSDINWNTETTIGEIIPAMSDRRAFDELVMAGKRGVEAGGGGAREIAEPGAPLGAGHAEAGGRRGALGVGAAEATQVPGVLA